MNKLSYKEQTDAIVEDYNSMILANQDIFNKAFVPNTYEDMYSYNFLDKNKGYASLSDFSKSVSQLKREINAEIHSILAQSELPLNASSSVKEFIGFRDRLWALEDRISTYPILSFVGMLIERGTVMDIIGFLEKLRYDIVYRGVSGHIKEKTVAAMDVIVIALSKRYGENFYAEIESFKQEYIKGYEYAGKLEDVRDTFATVQRYRSFMDALKNAILKGRFSLSPDGYRQEVDAADLSIDAS